MTEQTKSLSVLILFLFLCLHARAQDLIIKINGDTTRAKILEVGTNAVSYKKANYPDGPTFIENVTNIALIKFANGQVEQFSKSTNPSTSSIANSNTSSQSTGNDKVKIEMVNNGYTINGQKASQKEVNSQLAM